jgi:adenylate cyclase
MIPPALGFPHRVLVVDDSPQNAALAQAYLRAFGCVVRKAGSGPQCLAAVDADPPELILLDAEMPEMDGLEVCRRLKAHKTHRFIPIILLTTLNSSRDRIRGLEAGADDFISKPFSVNEITARVKSLLKMKRAQDAERSRLRGTLERYVDPSVAQQMLDSPDLIPMAGRRQQASILFADVRGFTAWSETRSPEAVVELVNLFLAESVEAIFQHGGAVDKFMGDGLMAHFGAIIPDPDHPRKAVAAALQIAKAAAAITHPDLPTPLSAGCGINSGDLVIGNIGSLRRMEFTAVGDVVNVASRLTQEAGGGQVLVSEATYKSLGSADAVDLGLKLLKNRREPVRAYSIIRLN